MGYLCATIFVVLAVATQNAYSIRCWSCSSDVNPQCMDFFNATSYSRDSLYGRRQDTPQLVDCNSFGSPATFSLPQRAVCMKKVQTNYGRRVIIRQCHTLMGNEQVGYCPTETTSSSISVEYCQYCDHDGCNGANSMDKSAALITLLPLALFYYFRH